MVFGAETSVFSEVRTVFLKFTAEFQPSVSLHPDGPATCQINLFPVFFGPRTNAGLVPKFRFALHVSHAAVSKATLNFSL
jgi:hypothetical protein